MSKLLCRLSLCLMLLSFGSLAFADDYDDCMHSCDQALAPCVDQVKLSAGDIQEEKDGIAACNKSKTACTDACDAAVTTPETPPAPAQEPPAETLNGKIKIYQFNDR